MPAELTGFPYRAMAGPHLCGPTAMAQALDFLRIGPGAEGLERVWRFRRGSDSTDTPGHHLRVLRRLGIPHAIRQRLTLGEISAAISSGKPVVALLSVGRMLRHWVVVTGVAEHEVVLAWGDRAEPVTLDRDRFGAAHSGGALDLLMGTRSLGYAVGEALPWPNSPSLDLYFRLQRPVAEHFVVPVVEGLLGGLRRSEARPDA